MISQTFGRADKPGRAYDNLVDEYKLKLSQGGKAPARFVPENNAIPERDVLSEKLAKLITALCVQIETFTEEELDGLLIPHPLLGNLTLREMLFNAIYHLEHHHEIAKENLKNK